MEAKYSANDLQFLSACLDDVQERLQGLLNSSRGRVDRQETLNSLTRIESAKRALSARKDGDMALTLDDLRVFYISVHAKRDEINRILDVPGSPVDMRDKLMAGAATCNAILRVIRSNVKEMGMDLEQFIRFCNNGLPSAAPAEGDDLLQP